jgi:arsenite oxidase small subunit
MRRRHFFRLCAGGAGIAAVPGLLHPSAPVVERSYARVRLVNANGGPLHIDDLEPGETYLFHYPMAATQCFLIRLDRPAEPVTLRTRDGAEYRWDGGVGPEHNVVAYSAICAHKMAHPSRVISYIDYRPELHEGGADSGIISCCAEGSAYDPRRGGRVLSGPAEQPLASILLEHDLDEDALFAAGTLGGEMFDRYFQEFGHRLMLEYPRETPDSWMEGVAPVQTLETFTRSVVHCGVSLSKT